MKTRKLNFVLITFLLICSIFCFWFSFDNFKTVKAESINTTDYSYFNNLQITKSGPTNYSRGFFYDNNSLASVISGHIVNGDTYRTYEKYTGAFLGNYNNTDALYFRFKYIVNDYTTSARPYYFMLTIIDSNYRFLGSYQIYGNVGEENSYNFTFSLQRYSSNDHNGKDLYLMGRFVGSDCPSSDNKYFIHFYNFNVTTRADAGFTPNVNDVCYYSSSQDALTDSYNKGYTNGYNAGYSKGYTSGSSDSQYSIFSDSRFSATLDFDGYSDISYSNLTPDYVYGGVQFKSFAREMVDIDSTKYDYLNTVTITLYLNNPVLYDAPCVYYGFNSDCLDNFRLLGTDDKWYTFYGDYENSSATSGLCKLVPYDATSLPLDFTFTAIELFFGRPKDLAYEVGFYTLDVSYQTGVSDGYNTGYKDGYNASESSHYDDLQTKYKTGYNVGYSTGYNKGVTEGSSYSFLNLMTSVIDAPLSVFQKMFNFEVLGVNMSSFYLSLFTACIIFVVLRFIF